MKNASDRVALLIPVYNGKDSIEEVLKRCKVLELPIFVVDDGSTDDTVKRVKAIGVDALVLHATNQGKGEALKDGLIQAGSLGYEAVITLDADGQHLPEEVPKFLECYAQSGADIIVGNRFDDAEYLRRMPAVRAFSNRFSSFLIRKVGQLNIKDVQCGFRLYKTDPFLALDCQSSGFEFETEVLITSAASGYQLENVPIRCEYPEGTVNSQYRALRDSWQIFQVCWRGVKTSKKRRTS